MATLEDIARSGIAALSSVAPLPLVIQWAGQRYREIAGQARLPHLRKRLELYLPTAITAGTVTFTRGSDLAVGNATAAAAWPGDLDSRWKIKAEDVLQWYRLKSVNGTDLRLTVGYAGATVASSSYTLLQALHALPADARWLGPLIHERSGTIVERWTGADLDFDSPSRLLVANTPYRYRDAGSGPSGERLIEVYPPPDDEPQIVVADYWPDPPALGMRDPLPPRVDAETLLAGVKASIATWEAARARTGGNPELALSWGIEGRNQSGMWAGAKAQILGADGGDEQEHVVLEGYGDSLDLPVRITTAEQEYWLLR